VSNDRGSWKDDVPEFLLPLIFGFIISLVILSTADDGVILGGMFFPDGD
jgi:hypothetical protein